MSFMTVFCITGSEELTLLIRTCRASCLRRFIGQRRALVDQTLLESIQAHIRSILGKTVVFVPDRSEGSEEQLEADTKGDR